jgi:hypothetical protein
VLICFCIHNLNLMAQEPPGSLILRGPQSVSHDNGGITAQQRAMIRKAAQALEDEGAKAQAEYLTAYAPLTNPPILNMSQVTNKSDLQLRTTKVREYLIAAHRYQHYSEHFVEHFDGQIRTNVTDESIRKILQEETRGFYVKIQIQATAARQLEVRIGEDYLEGLSFLEKNWDKWRPKTPVGSAPVFKESDLVLQYDDIIHDINDLRAQEIKVHNQAMAEIAQMDQDLKRK